MANIRIKYEAIASQNKPHVKGTVNTSNTVIEIKVNAISEIREPVVVLFASI